MVTKEKIQAGGRTIQLHSWAQTASLLIGFAASLVVAGWWASQELNKRVTKAEAAARAAVVDRDMREKRSAIHALDVRVTRLEMASESIEKSADRLEAAVKALNEREARAERRAARRRSE